MAGFVQLMVLQDSFTTDIRLLVWYHLGFGSLWMVYQALIITGQLSTEKIKFSIKISSEWNVNENQISSFDI